MKELQGEICKVMNNIKLNQIKQKALEEKIPIIMDDTLQYLDSLFLGKNIDKILEIGTATRIFFYMFFEIFIR